MSLFRNARFETSIARPAGLPLPGVQISIRAPDGAEVPADGKTMGDLFVRGPWVVDRYFKGEGGEQFTADGWFRTGDVAIASPRGYFVIGDRTKDLIKSGGEWISSVDMERTIMALPEVEEAAVIAIPDPKWQERPLLIVVKKPGHDVTREEMRHYLAGKVAGWWLPDDVVFANEMPHTATGKLLKTKLREMFSDYRLP